MTVGAVASVAIGASQCWHVTVHGVVTPPCTTLTPERWLRRQKYPSARRSGVSSDNGAASAVAASSRNGDHQQSTTARSRRRSARASQWRRSRRAAVRCAVVDASSAGPSAVCSPVQTAAVSPQEKTVVRAVRSHRKQSRSSFDALLPVQVVEHVALGGAGDLGEDLDAAQHGGPFLRRPATSAGESVGRWGAG